MPLTPIELQKMSFTRRWRGYDAVEVENFLAVVAEELACHLGELERLERENRYYKMRLQESQQREGQLQETLLHAQRVSEQLATNAAREADLRIKEAEATARDIVARAMAEAVEIEGRIRKLKVLRHEVFFKVRQTLDFFQRMLGAEQEEDKRSATIRTLPQKRVQSQSDASAEP
jgi:cell division initiation protein